MIYTCTAHDVIDDTNCFRIVDALIQSLDRHFQDMTIEVSRPFGSPAVLQVHNKYSLIIMQDLIVVWILE